MAARQPERPALDLRSGALIFKGSELGRDAERPLLREPGSDAVGVREAGRYVAVGVAFLAVDAGRLAEARAKTRDEAALAFEQASVRLAFVVLRVVRTEIGVFGVELVRADARAAAAGAPETSPLPRRGRRRAGGLGAAGRGGQPSQCGRCRGPARRLGPGRRARAAATAAGARRSRAIPPGGGAGNAAGAGGAASSAAMPQTGGARRRRCRGAAPAAATG